MNLSLDYDITIIGGGIAGLYAAYKILKMSPKTRFLLLERSNRRDLGGRASNVMFHGASVVTGAGIGRKNKDKFLQKLNQKQLFVKSPVKNTTN